MQNRIAISARYLAAGMLLTAASASHGALCFFTSLPALVFGNYNPFSVSSLDSATTAQIFCTRTVPGAETVTMNVTLSTGGSGSYFPRQLNGPAANRLNYNLYRDAARTTIFGNGTPGTALFATSFMLNGGRRTMNIAVDIFGRISAGQDPGVGSYNDTIILTVTY